MGSTRVRRRAEEGGSGGAAGHGPAGPPARSWAHTREHSEDRTCREFEFRPRVFWSQSGEVRAFPTAMSCVTFRVRAWQRREGSGGAGEFCCPRYPPARPWPRQEPGKGGACVWERQPPGEGEHPAGALRPPPATGPHLPPSAPSAPLGCGRPGEGAGLGPAVAGGRLEPWGLFGRKSPSWQPGLLARLCPSECVAL